MIRPYLKDLINYHKPTTRLSNEENNSDTNETTNSDDERGEWKIQLVMQNNCISIKSFEDTRTVYSASKPVEVFVGSNTDDATDALFDTVLQRFQKAIETSNDNGSGFTNEYIALLYYNFQKIDIQRAESYIKSPDWLVNKGATINRRNENDNKCFQYAITIALNYNKIKKYIFAKNREVKMG